MRWQGTGQRWMGLALTLGALCTAPAFAEPAAATASADLTRTVESLDKTLFEAYNACELDKFGAMFDADVEFYHDKGGLMVSRQAVVEATRKHICGKVRRELVAGSLQVYAMDGYGAVQLGSHRFCETATTACQGVAKFMHLWRLREGVWQLTRVISFDHQALALPPPSTGDSRMKDMRFVVLHRPGPRWQTGVPLFEQAGLGEHIAHYRQWLTQGKLMVGGPFLDDQAGGMMVPEPGVGEAEIRDFALRDPAVVSGLLTVEIRPWLVGMKKD